MSSWAAPATPVRDSLATSTHKRLDIQGLRAIAVVMVVAFHAGLPVPGGFVGVDVFFVISGFVITAMLHREWVSTGRIRFRQFYLKRFRRLTPALALMVACTVVISSVVLYPFADQENVVKTAFGAMLLAANFVISKTTGGYFGAAAEANPLLNTWSLSVEEQFYLIFPAVLVLGWVLAKRRARLRGAPFLLIGSIATLSFGLALAQTLGWTFFGSEIFLGFYSTFTRAWEFAAGALLAIVLTKFTISLTPRFMSTVGAVGIGMLAASLWLITGSTSFPGPWTLLPVIGTLLLLLAGTCENRVSRALSTRPMVRIGDWSYSIYLWHWPFIVFAIYLWPFSPYAAVLAAVISLAPALASYYWLEQPIRQRVTRNRIQTTKLITAVMIPPLILAALVGVTAKYYWQPQYLSLEKPVLYEGDLLPVEEWVYLRGPYSPCDEISALYQAQLSPQEIEAGCGQSKPGEPVDIAIVGDSHAVHLFFGLAEALPKKNVAYFALAAKPPVDDGAEMTRIIDYIAQNPSIKTVILSAYWSSYGVSEEKFPDTLQRFAQSGKQVFVTDDLPDYPFTPDQCKYGISPIFPTARCSQDVEVFDATYSRYYPQLEQVVSQVPGVRLLPTAKYFCDETKCDMTRDGILLYADDDHLNHQGSRFLAERLLENSPEFTQLP